jgi:hypothetical protein
MLERAVQGGGARASANAEEGELWRERLSQADVFFDMVVVLDVNVDGDGDLNVAAPA